MLDISYIKSPLNYTGGKFKLLPQIIPLFPCNVNKFIDLFCGGCNVAINVQAEKIICNDILNPLIETYATWQKMDIEEIYEHINKRIAEFSLSKTNKEGYLEFRKYYNTTKNPLDMYLLSCYSFNYQIRFNSKGEWNMPYGSRQYSENMKNNLKLFWGKIKDMKFTSKSFEECRLEVLSNKDFIYADPPYLVSTATYNENGGWGEQQERTLLNKLDEAHERGIRFALSNVLESKGKSNEILKEWSNKYHIYYLSADYSNCNYQTRGKENNKSKEVLITNY